MMEVGKERASVGVLRNLASKMLFTQNSDIAVMTGMLAERGASPLPPPR